MGCSSSAQTQVVDGSRPAPKSPDANGPFAGDDSNLPVTNENEIIPEQTKLGAIDEVELGSRETKLSDNLAKDEADALIPGITDCTLSTSQRVDPEGTEPQPMTLEEKFNSTGPLTAGLLEAGEPQPVKLPEDTTTMPQLSTELDTSQSETVQDSEPEPPESTEGSTPEPVAAENLSLVTEIVREFLVAEDEQPVTGETGEKTETEMNHEIVSEDSETKEEETREATPAIEIESINNEE